MAQTESVGWGWGWGSKKRFKKKERRSRRGAAEMNPTRNHDVLGCIPGLAQWVKDLALLRLWCRLAAVALIRLLTLGLPHATGAALKSKKKKIKGKEATSYPVRSQA